MAEQVAQDLIEGKYKNSDRYSYAHFDLIKPNTSDHLQNRIAIIRQELRELTWRAAGICREAKALSEAIAQIIDFQQEIMNLRSNTRLWVETRNLIDFAYLLVKSALFRTESRGAHFRIDYLDTESDWKIHTVICDQDIYTQ